MTFARFRRIRLLAATVAAALLITVPAAANTDDLPPLQPGTAPAGETAPNVGDIWDVGCDCWRNEDGLYWYPPANGYWGVPPEEWPNNTGPAAGEPARPASFGHHNTPYTAIGPWWPTQAVDPANYISVTDGIPKGLVEGARLTKVRFTSKVLPVTRFVRRNGKRVRVTVYVKHLVVTTHIGDVMPRGTYRLDKQTVTLAVRRPDGKFLQFLTATDAPKVVMKHTPERMFIGSRCGTAKMNFTRDKVIQRIPVGCLGGRTSSKSLLIDVSALRKHPAGSLDATPGAVGGFYHLGGLNW